MPKKANTQLDVAVEIIRKHVPIRDKAVKNEMIAAFAKQFGCSEKTAYYYYFYKAAGILKKSGVCVMDMPKQERKVAAKKLSKERSIAEILDSLPPEVSNAMKKSSPFAALGV